MPLSARFRSLVAAVCAAVLLPLAVGCGGGSGGDPGADPAAIVPGGAAVYLEGNLKPGDDVKQLAKKLSGEDDPGGAIKRAIEKQARKTDKDFKFSDDVEPWLGDRVGVFLPRLQAGESPAGIVVPTKDPDKAKEFLEKELRSPGEDGQKPQIVERTHRDTKYLVDTTDDQGVAIVDDYAVFGSDAAIKGTLDAQEGESLAESSEYEKARNAVEEDRVGFVYLRLSQIFSSLGPQGAAARQVFKGFGETVAIGLNGDPSTIKVESAALGVSGKDGGGAGPGDVLAELPASAWVAAGVSDVGGRIQRAIEQFTQLGALGGQDPERLLDQIEREFGIDPRRDIAAWMGDIGVFAFGDSLAELGGGMVAKVKDAGAARRAFPRITRFLRRTVKVGTRPLSRSGIAQGVTLRSPQLPLPVHLALTDDDRFIVAVTNAALSQALQRTEPLGESAPFKEAAGKLGGLEPAVFLNFQPLAALLDSTGQGSDPTVAKIREALGRLTTLAAGTKREGDIARGRLVVGVK
ncbi:MAG TPA: DUF3352 domain-containing protein [Solirubrobacteraceae bacterium]|jgi:hypothetical protein